MWILQSESASPRSLHLDIDIYIYKHIIEGVGWHRERNKPCYRHPSHCAHHDVSAFAETSIAPYPNSLIELFLFNRRKRSRSDWQVYTITGRCQRREGNQSCPSRHVMYAAGFAAAHDRRTFRRTFDDR